MLLLKRWKGDTETKERRGGGEKNSEENAVSRESLVIERKGGGGRWQIRKRIREHVEQQKKLDRICL